MCEYCQLSTLNNDLDNKDITDFYDKDSKTLTLWNYGDSEMITEPMLLFMDIRGKANFGSFVIKYCPMCGRKLDEDRAD